MLLFLYKMNFGLDTDRFVLCIISIIILWAGDIQVRNVVFKNMYADNTSMRWWDKYNKYNNTK